MQTDNNIDLKVIAEFVQAYKRLYQAGEINKEQFLHYMQILENLESYDPDELRRVLEE